LWGGDQRNQDRISPQQGKHVGKWVEYRGGPGKIEIGKIKSWNDRVVFVVYRFTGSDENEVIRQARVCCDGNSHRIFL
jgi:hypothetical protein